MSWSDDPIRDYSNWDYTQYLREKSCPVCNDCGDPITAENYWEFHGAYYCENCVREHKYYTEDYIEGK